MKNMKRLIAVLMVLAMAMCFAACTDPQENPTTSTPAAHTHAYGTEWKSDAENHWNECACGEKSNAAAHADENTDGKCDVCAAEVSVEDPEPTYIATVVDQDGNPVAGVAVQLCDDNMCYLYQLTDENGVVNFFQKIESGAKVMILTADGYTFSSDYVKYAEGENTVTLTITRNAE